MVQRINDVNYGEAFEQMKGAAEAALLVGLVDGPTPRRQP
jgi:hypothetical protein